MTAMRAHEHLRDEELLLLLDGEAGAREQEWIAHVAQCQACGARRAQLEQAMANWVASRPSTAPPAMEQPLANLRRGLETRSRHWLRYAAAACVMAAVAGGVLWNTHLRAPAGPLPDARLTPGAARALTRDEVCGLAEEDGERRAPVELARRVFRDYRIARPRARAYELDYLISPALGGAEEARNLWPQPYAEGIWNSRVKDALEDDLRRQVCSGALELTSVQAELAEDWIATYKRHFRSERPLAEHRGFMKDQAWE
ncbi:MAG: hypothetical protein J0L64_06950 [Acidobacteria bacterium]|nr:hypothetical protein [Acidobacteriota bacterium]